MKILSQDAHAGFDHISRIADFSNDQPAGSSFRPISPDPTIFDKPVFSVTHSFPDLLNVAYDLNLRLPPLIQMVLRGLGGSSNLPRRLRVSFVRGGGRLAKFMFVDGQLAHSIGENVECRLGVFSGPRNFPLSAVAHTTSTQPGQPTSSTSRATSLGAWRARTSVACDPGTRLLFAVTLFMWQPRCLFIDFRFCTC